MIRRPFFMILMILAAAIAPPFSYSAQVVADMVAETTTTTGTGTIDLDGAISGYRTFIAGIGTGNTCTYQIKAGTEWEIGLGTVTDANPDTLSRDTVYSSSNAGALVDFSAGIKTVICTQSAHDITNHPAVNVTVADTNGRTDQTTVEGWLDELAATVGGIVSFPGFTSLSADYSFGTTDINTDGTLKTGSVGADELASTAVTPGAYTNADITVDADGRVTAAANGSAGATTLYGHIILPAPFSGGAGLTANADATFTNEYYGQAKFSNSTDQATNYVEYRLLVPEDMDTTADVYLESLFVSMSAAGTDTNTQRYVISMDVIGSDDDLSGTQARSINIDLTESASTASGDAFGTTTQVTLTDWKTDLSGNEGKVWIIRLARDGNDGTYDTSTVDTYSGPLMLSYTKD